MKKWIIPVAWEMSGEIEIEANTLAEAMDRVFDGDIGLPDGDYVDGSFDLWTDDEDNIRYVYNSGQTDDEEI